MTQKISSEPASPAREAGIRYWIDNTDYFYRWMGQDGHISHVVLEAFEAGAKWARENPEEKSE